MPTTVSPLLMTPMINAPTIVFTAPPAPPVIAVPPTTTVAMEFST